MVVSEAMGQFIDDIPVDFIERKGVGHSDSLCDGIAERVNHEYTRWCEENLGCVLHHNFNKVQLVAGEISLFFGGDNLIKPIRIQLTGRGTLQVNGKLVSMDDFAIETAKKHIRQCLLLKKIGYSQMAQGFLGTVARVITPASVSGVAAVPVVNRDDLKLSVLGKVAHHPIQESELNAILSCWLPEEVHSALDLVIAAEMVQVINVMTKFFGARESLITRASYPINLE